MLGLAAVSVAAMAATPGVCPESAAFYEAGSYSVGKIEIRSPFDFLTVVRKHLSAAKSEMPLREKAAFSKAAFDASFEEVKTAVNADGVFGTSPAKFVWVSDQMENCDAGAKTLDVVYRVYSTDPILAGSRAANTSAADTARSNTNAAWRAQPLLGYDRARRGFGGGDFWLKLPGGLVDDLHLAGSGSSSSMVLDAQANGTALPRKLLLDRVDYKAAYHYIDLPAAALQFSKSVGDVRFTASSRPGASFGLRYGASIEKGNQHSGGYPRAAPEVLSNSGYGAVRFYAGLTHGTRHSSTAISYGLQRGGSGLTEMRFTKNLADAVYSLRVPGAKHRPWDLEARASGGAISTAQAMPLVDRFFGGNAVASFIPGDTWMFPDGPVVRSLPVNRFTGRGVGGTSFYSGNLTVSKTLFGSPIIPAAIEADREFGTGLEAAENTAENFFADDYETASPQFKKAALDGADQLRTALQALQQTLDDTPAAPASDNAIAEIKRSVRRALNTLRHATTPDSQGKVQTLEIKQLLNPSTSPVRRAIDDLAAAATLTQGAIPQRLLASKAALQAGLTGLGSSLDAIHTGPVGLSARAHAKQDMVRPRAVVDTLRHEVNIYSVALVGLFDAGRLWPDPNGVRYALGGGVRLSLVNVNLTLGYARNPRPVRVLHEGPGAFFVQVSYTDLFR